MKESEKEQFSDRYKEEDARQPNVSCSMSCLSIAERKVRWQHIILLSERSSGTMNAPRKAKVIWLWRDQPEVRILEDGEDDIALPCVVNSESGSWTQTKWSWRRKDREKATEPIIHRCKKWKWYAVSNVPYIRSTKFFSFVSQERICCFAKNRPNESQSSFVVFCSKYWAKPMAA